MSLFLDKGSYKTCNTFIYYAYRGDKLTDRELEDYDITWLKKHQVTILEDKKLRFNFPTSGKLLLDVLRCFVKESEEDTVDRLRKKERSFAGFLFEARFYNYCGSKNLVSRLSGSLEYCSNSPLSDVSVCTHENPERSFQWSTMHHLA